MNKNNHTSRLCLLVALAILLAAPAAQPSIRPLQDLRWVLNIAPREGGFDVFWVHENELAPPVRAQLLATSFTAAGVHAGRPVVVSEGDAFFTPAIDHTELGAVAAWTNLAREFRVAGVEGEELQDGQLLANYADTPMLRCSAARCVAVWRIAGEFHAAETDARGRMTRELPFPKAWNVLQLIAGDETLFVVYGYAGQTRAALLERDGATRFEVPLPITSPFACSADFDGAQGVAAGFSRPAKAGRYTVAWVDSNAIHLITIGGDGDVQDVASPYHLSESSFFSGRPALAWNGSEHLLLFVEGSVDGAAVRAIRLDSSLRPTSAGAVTVATRLPYGVSAQAAPLDRSFVLSWNPAAGPMIAVMDPAGRISAPTPVDEPAPRRRATR